MKQFFLRVGAGVVVGIGIFVLPWWLWVFLALASVAIVNRQYELVLFGFLADAAYSGSVDNPRFLMSTISLGLVALSIILKPRLKFYTSV